MIAVQIARLIANFMIFLELSGEELLDLDEGVEFGEFLSYQLTSLDHAFLRELVDAFASIVPEYSGEAQQLVRDMAYGFYLEEELAADDPVRLAELDAIREAREY